MKTRASRARSRRSLGLGRCCLLAVLAAARVAAQEPSADRAPTRLGTRSPSRSPRRSAAPAWSAPCASWRASRCRPGPRPTARPVLRRRPARGRGQGRCAVRRRVGGHQSARGARDCARRSPTRRARPPGRRFALKPLEVIERAVVSSVILEPSVRDERGGPVNGLRSTTSCVTEDGVPQKADLLDARHRARQLHAARRCAARACRAA